jgi:glycosyltransferase involved in cell wall biosynthesis
VKSLELKVSIVVPVYNCEKTIEQCLSSLINQTYRNKEIIIVDDGSVDNTSEILKKFAKLSDVKIIKFPTNRGASLARNEGIKHATGEIIFIAEADAYYAKDYIELCVKHFENSKTGTVIGALHAWPENTIWYKWWEAKRRIVLYNYKPLGGWFFRKDDLEKIGYYRSDLKIGEDRELCLRLKRLLGLEWIYEPNALWYHKYPYGLKVLLHKAFRNGFNSIRFNRILNIHRKMLIRSIIYLILVTSFLILTLQATISKNILFLLYPLTLVFFAFVYPIYQLSSRSININEFKEYILLFPIIQGLETFFLSLGYILGTIKNK